MKTKLALINYVPKDIPIESVVRSFESSFGLKVSYGPICVQHGLFSSSADGVLNVGHENLAFNLSDAGYDVWIGSVRTLAMVVDSPNDVISVVSSMVLYHDDGTPIEVSVQFPIFEQTRQE